MKEKFWSTNKLINFVDKHYCGGVPTWGKGRQVQRCMRVLKSRKWRRDTCWIGPY